MELKRFELSNGQVRFYVNGTDREKLYIKIGSAGRAVWSSAHNDKQSKGSSAYEAIRKDRAAFNYEVKPWIESTTGKAFAELTADDLESLAQTTR